tara:strand:+ start:966 stop:2210 length:1245 start_codon:yes stop_codon:yes gene_type:complete
MASTYKTFLNDDVVTTRTLLHEAIPITGSIVYGTYGDGPVANEKHVKTFAHGMFQSVYDYPYLSSSANHIFDIAYGYHADDGNATRSDGVGETQHDYYSKRKNIYNQMAQILVGHDTSGNIQKFDADGDIIAGGDKYTSCIFLNFARLLNKDEIKKGSFEIVLGVHKDYEAQTSTHGAGTTLAQAAAMHAEYLTIKDEGAATDYRVNSPAGEYGILKVTTDTTSTDSSTVADPKCGLIFYQAGIVVLTTDVFVKYASSTVWDDDQPGTHVKTTGKIKGADGNTSVEIWRPSAGKSFTIDRAINENNADKLTNDQLLTNIRKRIAKICFNNTTELNSTIYFCRINHNDFNYSSNPTYLSSSQIRVKNTQSDAPVSYITTVGLYSSDNEMLAVAKLSEPLRKDPTNDVTLRVRLDY